MLETESGRAAEKGKPPKEGGDEEGRSDPHAKIGEKEGTGTGHDGESVLEDAVEVVEASVSWAERAMRTARAYLNLTASILSGQG